MHASYDVAIIGAGFAGLACAKRLAEQGVSVIVLDRKKYPGQGMHTTGIVVKEAVREMELPDSITRKITDIRLYAPSLKSIDLQSSEYFFLTTDTTAMMQHLSAQAEASGATVQYGKSFTGAMELDDGQFELSGHDLHCRYLIGADGPRSKVAEHFKLGTNTAYLLGAEAEFAHAALPNPNAFYCFLDQALAYGYIGWVIPGVGITQVGLATRLPVKPNIDAFTDKVTPLFDLDRTHITGRRGGLIPVGGIVSPMGRGNVLLLGDAAGMVSPFSAGGIHTALHYGRMLADAIVARQQNIQAAHPLQVMQQQAPRFRVKHCLRWIFEHCAWNWLLNLVLGNVCFRVLANAVFYQTKRLPDS